MSDQKEVECCPKFDSTPWDDKIIKWEEKKFIRDSVFSFFYIPINFGSVMVKMTKQIEGSGGTFVDGMCLSEHSSPWKMNVFLAVDKQIDGAENMTISGTFLTKVYEGDFKDIGTWMKDFESFAKGKGMSIKKKYMWYTTCPACAKKYGKNYIVIVGLL